MAWWKGLVEENCLLHGGQEADVLFQVPLLVNHLQPGHISYPEVSYMDSMIQLLP